MTKSITDHAECLNNKIEIRYSINRLIEIMTLRVTLARSVYKYHYMKMTLIIGKLYFKLIMFQPKHIFLHKLVLGVLLFPYSVHLSPNSKTVFSWKKTC